MRWGSVSHNARLTGRFAAPVSAVTESSPDTPTLTVATAKNPVPSTPGMTAVPGSEGVAAETIVVIELMAKEPFEPPPGFAVTDQRKYGKARLVFLALS